MRVASGRRHPVWLGSRVGFTISYVIAPWDRPLAQLRANDALADLEVDPGYSWERADGWQCFAPTDFYGDEPMPPVERIQKEVGGPVLGMYVLSSSDWELAFCLDGEIQSFRPFPHYAEADEAHLAEMTSRWGPDWLTGVSAGLVRWASPFAQVDASAVRATVAAPFVYPEDRLGQLQRVLTLVPAADHPWWGAPSPFAMRADEIPGARWFINPIALNVEGLGAPGDHYSHPKRQLVLALTTTGFGIWDRDPGTWAREPDLSLETALDHLAELLFDRGWRRR